jgi:FAD/FMN-containing dehydrogenase
VREIDVEREPELFWAIRGGGGNFGVVTRFDFRLAEVPEIVGGMLLLPATPETVTGFLAAADAAPEGLSTIANVMPAPPMPFVPAERHGETVLMALVCFAGPAEEGDRAIAPLRALAEPLVDMVKPMTYPEIYGPEPEDYHPAAVIRTTYVDGIDADQAATTIERVSSSDAPMRVTQLRVLGGAIDRVPAGETAYAHRGQRIMANVASFYTGTEDRAFRQAWVDDLSMAIDPAGESAYVNFLGDEGPERVRAAYPGETWDRLVAVKRRYDPDNFFRSNQNIPPG